MNTPLCRRRLPRQVRQVRLQSLPFITRRIRHNVTDITSRGSLCDIRVSRKKEHRGNRTLACNAKFCVERMNGKAKIMQVRGETCTSRFAFVFSCRTEAENAKGNASRILGARLDCSQSSYDMDLSFTVTLKSPLLYGYF